MSPARVLGSGRGGSGSGEGKVLGWQLATCRGATDPKDVAHARGGLEVKRGGGRWRWPRRSDAAVWSGGDGVKGGEPQRPYIQRMPGGDDGVMAGIPPYHGALVGARTGGAADGPAVRRTHGTRTAPRRGAVEAPRARRWPGEARGLGPRTSSGGGTSDGVRARTPRARVRRRDATSRRSTRPARFYFAEPYFRH
jgi:hypothetical protein